MASAFYTDEINAASNRYGVPADLLRSVIMVESSGNRFEVGKAGEKGLMQIMDGTARDLGLVNPFDPAENIDAGAKYLSQLYKKSGDWRETLARYNGGKYFAGTQAQGYADKVINEYTKIGGDGVNLDESTQFKGKICINGKCPGDIDQEGEYNGGGGDVDTGGIEGSSDIPAWLKAIISWIADNALRLALVLMAVLIIIFGVWRLINGK